MEKRVKKSNLYADIGFLLTLLNIVIGFPLIMAKSTLVLLTFSPALAVLSLILCISGKAISKKLDGKGKILSVSGIVLNALILAAVLILFLYLTLGLRSSNGV